MTCRESGSSRWAFLPEPCAVLLPVELLPSCGWPTVPGGQQGFIFCRGGGGALIVCRTLESLQYVMPSAPHPRPPRTSLHLPLPPLPVSSSHFAARIVIWCELDLLPDTPELGVHILLHPTHAPPLNWIISFRLLRLQFCFMVTQASTQNRCYSEIWCRMYL